MQPIDLESRGRQILKRVEVRARHLVSALEKEAEKQLTPWLRRLDVPSRREVQRLSRQISELERRWRATQSTTKASAVQRTVSRRRTTTATPRKPIDSQRYAELFWDEV